MGRVIRAMGDGLTVHLPEGRRGRVCLSDIHDKYVNNALTGEMLAFRQSAVVFTLSSVQYLAYCQL